MPSRRYTVLIADRSSGAMRRFTVSARPAVLLVCAAVTVPALVSFGGAWQLGARNAELQSRTRALADENATYRAAVEELTGEIDSLQQVVVDLGAGAALDPGMARAMNALPAVVKARAMGGSVASKDDDQVYTSALTALADPEETFGPVRAALRAIESRLDVVRRNLEGRNALAAATPSVWPAYGWLSSAMGRRTHPTTGTNDYHSGLDIAGNWGQPVYATADGVVTHAGTQGVYGKLLVIDHGFGLQSRYGHLSAFLVEEGDRVERGDVIGNLGSTGRATGPHLHYEVMADGRLLNPLRLLAQQRPRDR